MDRSEGTSFLQCMYWVSAVTMGYILPVLTSTLFLWFSRNCMIFFGKQSIPSYTSGSLILWKPLRDQEGEQYGTLPPIAVDLLRCGETVEPETVSPQAATSIQNSRPSGRCLNGSVPNLRLIATAHHPRD